MGLPKDAIEARPLEGDMTEVNRYRDGELSSTRLMQEGMEKSHAVESGAGEKLDWRADHESMDAARARIHDEPSKGAEYVAIGLAAYAAKSAVKKVATEAGKEVVKSLKKGEDMEV